MKKNLFYLSMLAMGLAFTACSTDGDDVTVANQSATSSAAPALSQNTSESCTYTISDEDAPFSEMSILDGNKVILTLNQSTPASETRRRAPSEKKDYMVGTYTFDGNLNTYTIMDEEGEDYCTVEVVNKESGKKTVLKVHLMSAGEIEDFDQEFEADEVEKMPSNDITQKLCREWKVMNTRLRHKDGVTAVKHFEDPAEAASLNAILDYAKTVATITEELDEGTAITSIQFTDDGKFCLFFKNGNHYIGKWSWSDVSKGYIDYEWDDEEMGNKFMKDGQAIFDVRTYKQVNYYVLTMAAQIVETNKTYKVELSFYMNEK